LAERLGWIHRLMRLAQESGLSFVPLVFSTHRGGTWIEHAERFWDLTSWRPGQADFHNRPDPARLEAACVALARLHRAWASVSPSVGRSPGIERRLECARQWAALIRSGWQPRFAAHDFVRPWAERAWGLVRRYIDTIPRALASWAERPVPLQPCLCDIWHDHVLFEGNTVTGLIDYGGIKPDQVAVDLARLLGSMVGDHREKRATGLCAYTRLRPLSLEEEALVPILDETGTLVGLANWLKWLYREEKLFEDQSAVARRLATLVERVESWNQNSVLSAWRTGTPCVHP
jgi:Ser/Thr protein kinase RdoA (MazF antagonist)